MDLSVMFHKGSNRDLGARGRPIDNLLSIGLPPACRERSRWTVIMARIACRSGQRNERRLTDVLY